VRKCMRPLLHTMHTPRLHWRLLLHSLPLLAGVQVCVTMKPVALILLLCSAIGTAGVPLDASLDAELDAVTEAGFDLGMSEAFRTGACECIVKKFGYMTLAEYRVLARKGRFPIYGKVIRKTIIDLLMQGAKAPELHIQLVRKTDFELTNDCASASPRVVFTPHATASCSSLSLDANNFCDSEELVPDEPAAPDAK